MIIKKRHIPYDLDDPNTTILHREIILSTPFLRKIYTKWYQIFQSVYNNNPHGQYLELGSGGGFLKDILPNVITSDILPLPYVDKQIDAQHLPFADNTLDGIFLLNVFHHIPNPALFLKEAERVLKPNGKIVMIEPACTLFSKFIYKKFHHEPFDENAGFQIEAGKPLSHSNQALPYIYFIREKNFIQTHYPKLTIQSIRYHTTILYLVSGGMSYYPVLPHSLFFLFDFIELLLSPVQKYTALFQTIIVQKI